MLWGQNRVAGVFQQEPFLGRRTLASAIGAGWKTATRLGDLEEGKPHSFLKTEGIPVPLTEWQSPHRHPLYPAPSFLSLSFFSFLPTFLLSFLLKSKGEKDHSTVS